MVSLGYRVGSALVRRYGWVDENGVGHGGGFPEPADIGTDENLLTEIVGYSSDPFTATDTVWFRDVDVSGNEAELFDWM
jgi:hypothetical protein